MSVLRTNGAADAAAALAAGRLAILPTETVYGLGSRADDPRAIARVYAAKGRPADHPLIVHVASADALDAWAVDIPDYARALAKACWPGPLSLILRRSPKVLDAVTGGQDTVALRVPGHPCTLDVIRQVGDLVGDPHVGIAAPSANRFGRVSPTTADHAVEELDDLLQGDDVALDCGPARVGVESTIVDCTGRRPAIVRPGQVDADAVAAITGLELVMPSRVRAPGTLASHYSPSASVVLSTAEDLALAMPDRATTGVLALAEVPTPDGFVRLSAPQDAEEYARVLYAALREADALGLDAVLAVPPPAEGIGTAVADRLTRAATGS